MFNAHADIYIYIIYLVTALSIFFVGSKILDFVRIYTTPINSIEDIWQFHNKHHYSRRFVRFKRHSISDSPLIFVYIKWYHLPNHYSRRANRVLLKYCTNPYVFNINRANYKIGSGVKTSNSNVWKKEYRFSYNEVPKEQYEH